MRPHGQLQRYDYLLLFSRVYGIVVRRQPDVSEEYVGYIIRV
jgi:hypothetical protein